MEVAFKNFDDIYGLFWKFEKYFCNVFQDTYFSFFGVVYRNQIGRRESKRTCVIAELFEYQTLWQNLFSFQFFSNNLLTDIWCSLSKNVSYASSQNLIVYEDLWFVNLIFDPNWEVRLCSVALLLLYVENTSIFSSRANIATISETWRLRAKL